MCNALCRSLSSGVLLGIAIRTGSPLSLNLAEPVWKELAGMNLTIADLSEVLNAKCPRYALPTCVGGAEFLLISPPDSITSPPIVSNK